MVKHLLTLAAAIFLFLACQKVEEGIDSFPILVTNPELDVDTSGITVSMAFTSKGSFKIQEAGFCIDSVSIKTFSAEKSSAVEGLGNESSYQKRIRRLFVQGKKYYIRSYVKVKDAIVLGNEVDFTGQRDIKPKITGCTPTEGLHPIDTIYVKGENFEFYKDKMTGVLSKEYGWDNEKVQLSIKYLDKNTIKVYGPIKEYYKLKIQFDKVNITSNTYFYLYKLSNVKIDKKASYSGDTLTLSWDNQFDKRDSWSLKISSNNDPQIIEHTDKYLKFKLPKSTWGWSVDFTYNNQKITENIQCKSPFNDIKVDGELKSGDKILIKTNFPIDESDLYSAYFLDYNAIPNQNWKYNLKYIDSRTLEFTIPDEAIMDKVYYNPDGKVTVILRDYYNNSNGSQLGKLTFSYKTSIGTRIGNFDFYYDIISMVMDGSRCNFMVNNGGGSYLLENRSSPDNYSFYLPSYMNGSGIAKDSKSGRIYFGWSYNSTISEVCVTDEKFHYIETIPFRTDGLVKGFHSSFFLNNKLYFLGYTFWPSVGDDINFRDIYSLDLTSKEYKKENIILPWKDECSSKIPYYRNNLEILYIRTHLINDDIYIELLSLGIKSIYKLNKSTMQFDYFGDFPNNPNGSKMYTYEFNNRWCVLVDDRVWIFDGSAWSEWAKTPASSTLYFENNGKKYFKVKDCVSLYMLPM